MLTQGTCGASQDNTDFEDALEAPPSRRPSRTADSMEGGGGHHRAFSFEASNESLETQGLGIDTHSHPPGNGHDAAAAPAPQQDDRPPLMSARLSKFVTDDPMFDASGMAEEPPLPPPPPDSPQHSRTSTLDAEHALQVVEPETQPPMAASTTSPARSRESSPRPMPTTEVIAPSPQDAQHPPQVESSHSRQSTAETISAAPTRGPSVVSRLSPEEEEKDGASAQDTERPVSPIAASERESRPSILANVNALRERSLSPGKDGEPRHSRTDTQDTIPTLLPSNAYNPRERSTSPGYLSSGQQSPKKVVPGSFDDAPVAASPPPSARLQPIAPPDRPSSASPPLQAPGLARTASTSFKSFLGRVGSIRKARSPPAPRQERKFSHENSIMERRNTGASLASMDSKHSLATIPDGEVVSEAGTSRKLTLQDQFQSLRRQEEFNFPGMASDTEEEDVDPEKTPVAARMSRDVDGEQPSSPTRIKDRSMSITASMKSPPLNPSLPPGTASGLTAGPAEEPYPVDWDLWQSVVYEGPAAVARTSGEELNRAIASGIPAAIRGVVWQVLAESKSEELENMYRTLKARGSENADDARPSPPSRQESMNTANGTAEKTEKESEASSVRSSAISGHSTPATSAMASPPASVHGDGAEIRTKLLAEKQKREREMISKLEKTIKRDMGSRTSYSKFTQSAGLQDGLFGVCKAYALFDETVGYAQGMNFIAMPLLFNMSEEEAFTLLVRLMNKYDVRSLFVPEMPGLHLRLYQFERLLEDHDPALYCHLRRRNVEPKLYATQWFLTLFAYRFPLQLVLRVYDLIFSEGLTAIMKFGIVLMQHNRDALLGMKDMSHLTTFLKDKLFDVYIDKSPSASSLLDGGFFGSVTGGADKALYRADEMVRDACAIHIPEATLAAYTQEWEDQQRREREQFEALETLRAANVALTAKVKELEDRSQAQDGEHVTLAGDLVKYKLENDTLHDENEALQLKSDELQKMVDAQPAEVEEKVRGEMQEILQKNERVQVENRGLKEGLDDLEEQLVNAKMHAAHVSSNPPFHRLPPGPGDVLTRSRQIQTEYDDLQQKWSSLQGLLNGKGSPGSR